MDTRKASAEPGEPPYSRSLSAAIDHAVIQVEAAEAIGDAETARAWRRALAELEQTVPESRP